VLQVDQRRARRLPIDDVVVEADQCASARRMLIDDVVLQADQCARARRMLMDAHARLPIDDLGLQEVDAHARAAC